MDDLCLRAPCDRRRLSKSIQPTSAAVQLLAVAVPKTTLTASPTPFSIVPRWPSITMRVRPNHRIVQPHRTCQQSSKAQPAMGELPTGTVTFLFSDIEGPTRLLTRLQDGYAGVLAKHQRAAPGGVR
jgi:hypothetical protein